MSFDRTKYFVQLICLRSTYLRIRKLSEENCGVYETLKESHLVWWDGGLQDQLHLLKIMIQGQPRYTRFVFCPLFEASLIGLVFAWNFSECANRKSNEKYTISGSLAFSVWPRHGGMLCELCFLHFVSALSLSECSIFFLEQIAKLHTIVILKTLIFYVITVDSCNT